MKKAIDRFNSNDGNEFKLGEEQANVLLQVASKIEGKSKSITVSGSAGCGKTTILQVLVDYFRAHKIEYVAAAPTHKAKRILTQYTGKNTHTIHKLIGLKPMLDIEDVDLVDLNFKKGKAFDRIPRNGVIIIDECSMINDVLYTYLIDLANLHNCIVYWTGDSKQLKPVKSKVISHAFSKGDVFKLTKVYRQTEDNPVLKIIDKLKEVSYDYFEEQKSEEGSLIKYTKWKEFIDDNVGFFKAGINLKDPNFAKLLAYTNKRVQGFNEQIRARLFPNAEEFVKGDLLTVTSPLADFYTSEDLIISSIRKTSCTVCGAYCSGYIATLDSKYVDLEIFILPFDTPKEKLEKMAEEIEKCRLVAIKSKSSSDWANYYSKMNSFASRIDLTLNGRVVKPKTIDYGYCLTVHKSQGSTYSTLLVDMEDIYTCKDSEERRQLQYVALSRTKSDIYMYDRSRKKIYTDKHLKKKKQSKIF